ncbi:gp97 [Mycobacterium phage Barnyard]|uniref:Uncharacterized protein n=1 Tax=Mycobacterium phage Barnyard TaxID=205880 RepID=Q855X5_9CAUD|nr:gp97 [Mycobacterium phage Barnyard]AAN02151.1 hypothetical protein PBI_BARNYARD_97 [Mycobacterium phage Barnyard]
MANTEQKPQKYTITAEVEFDITATSIPDAYRKFTAWMTKVFNDAFEQGIDAPEIVPGSFEGLAVVRNFDAEV